MGTFSTFERSSAAGVLSKTLNFANKLQRKKRAKEHFHINIVPDDYLLMHKKKKNLDFYLSIYLPLSLHSWQCGCVVSTVRSPAGLCVKLPRNFNSLSVVPPSPLLLQAVTEGVDGTASLSVRLVRSAAYICSTACLACLSCPACPLSLLPHLASTTPQPLPPPASRLPLFHRQHYFLL